MEDGLERKGFFMEVHALKRFGALSVVVIVFSPLARVDAERWRGERAPPLCSRRGQHTHPHTHVPRARRNHDRIPRLAMGRPTSGRKTHTRDQQERGRRERRRRGNNFVAAPLARRRTPGG